MGILVDVVNLESLLPKGAIMEYFEPLLTLITLFVMTALLCLVAVDLFLLSPLLSIGFFLIGVLGVMLTTDAIKSAFFP